MKKILFTCGQLKLGGVQKSLISLLERIESEDFELFVMIPNLNGELVKKVPKNVKILLKPKELDYLILTKGNIKLCLKLFYNKPLLLTKYLISLIRVFLKINDKKIEQKRFWANNHENFDFLNQYNKQFDVVVSYSGAIGNWNEYIIDKLKASKNICWIHGNYQVFGTKCRIEKAYLSKFNHIVTVSPKSKDLLLSEVPTIKEKTHVLYNIIDKNSIFRAASKFHPYETSCTAINIVSVSRLDKGKGLDIAIKAASKIIEDGYDIYWTILGEGSEYNSLSNLISDLKVQDRIFLIGSVENPYPYIKDADIFLHPSKGEGKSMSVDEAKVLGKSILITDFPTVNDQIVHLETGYIVPISCDGIYGGLKALIDNCDIRDSLEYNLENFEIIDKTTEMFINFINEE